MIFINFAEILCNLKLTFYCPFLISMFNKKAKSKPRYCKISILWKLTNFSNFQNEAAPRCSCFWSLPRDFAQKILHRFLWESNHNAVRIRLPACLEARLHLRRVEKNFNDQLVKTVFTLLSKIFLPEIPPSSLVNKDLSIFWKVTCMTWQASETRFILNK